MKGDRVLRPRQLELLDQKPHPEASLRDPGTQYGEVFTRRWVVELILDLVGYVSDDDLAQKVVIEPSCGTGAFLVPIVDRLITSARAHGHNMDSLGEAIRACDLLDANVQIARKTVAEQLMNAGLDGAKAMALATDWISTDDFLLTDEPGHADFVVGNPPYIRLEDVPAAVMSRYRGLCPTMRGRSDVYVGFIERGLSLLHEGGRLGFICADRWMRNQYGAALRELVSESFAVDAVITMHDVDAFEEDVSAYPAVVVLRNGPPGSAVVAETGREFGPQQAAGLSKWIGDVGSPAIETGGVSAARLADWPGGRDLWPAGSPEMLRVVADLERRFPPLEDQRTGTRVGIGLATGCDEVYLTPDATLVESDRLVPMVRASDIATGRVAWSGTFLVNPWYEGGLVHLGDFPRLARYLESNNGRLRARHVARKRPAQWYRTIDRVDPQLTGRPKLLLPDLKAAAHPVLDYGNAYPHHNLYFVVSDAWDLEVLGGLLLSDVANLFVGTYCVKMRGGCYRFQAQYLRRIRVPDPESISSSHRRGLSAAFAERDGEAATHIALQLYGLDGLPSKNGRW